MSFNPTHAAAEQVLPAVREMAADMVAVRHQIHAHPELAYEEFATSDLVANSKFRTPAYSNISELERQATDKELAD